MKYLVSSIMTGLLILLTGCVSNLSGESYSRNEVRQLQTVKMGTVIDVKLVQIEGTKSGVGAIAGAAAGGIAGSTVGGGRGSDIVAIAGAVAGGLLGGKAEEAYSRSQGVQLTVELTDGSYVSVVQQVSPNVHFRPGDRVRILTQNGVSRVTQ